tara:strand:+ start:60036 stop:63635 length:3600 start_codon:yes stop_codon:yes gene_type:complete
MKNIISFIFCFPLLFSISCTQNDSKVDDSFLGGVALSTSRSLISASKRNVISGGSILVSLSLMDQYGNSFHVPNSKPNVVFLVTGGTSSGTFGSVTNLENGTFNSTFTATTAGTESKIVATVDGVVVGSTVSIQVVPGTYSLANSYVSVSSSTVSAGSVSTVTLHILDSANGVVTDATGFPVVFTLSGGTSSGTFSSVTDNGNGTYTATFTGTIAGTSANISASISGQNITSTLPSISVFNGPASQVVFSTQPVGSVLVGTSLTAQPVVTIKDFYGNTVTTGADATANVTLALTAGTGALTGTLVRAAVGGVATFTGVAASTQGTGKVITATKASTVGSGGTAALSVASNSFSVFANFTMLVPYTAGTESSYVLSDSTRISLASGVVRLTPADQTDSANNTGATSGGFKSGTFTATQWDSTNSYLRLNSSNNQSELDSSWAPQWGSILAYWKMENNWNDSVGAFSGTGNNGVTFSSSLYKVGSYSGKFDTASTDDYVVIADPGTGSLLDFGFNDEIAMSVWLKNGVAGNDTTYRYIVGKGRTAANSTDQNWGIRTFSSAAGLYGISFVYRNSTDTAWHRWESGSVIPIAGWHHVVVSFKFGTGSSMKVYVDGNAIAGAWTLGAGDESPLQNNASVWIGNSMDLTLQYTGQMDELVLWRKALTQTEAKAIYSRQVTKYSGQFTSRVLDAMSSQSWTTLTAITTLPFFKEILGTSGNETSSEYSSIVGSTGSTSDTNALSNIVGVWHFDGTEGAITDDAVVVDSATSGTSGAAKDADATNTIQYQTGIFGEGISFDGVNDFVTVPNTALKYNFTDQSFTVSAWFKTSTTTLSFLVGHESLISGWGIGVTATGALIAVIKNSSATSAADFTTSSTFNDGNWHHVVGVFTTSTATQTGNSVVLYVDGALASGAAGFISGTVYNPPSTSHPLTFAARGTGTTSPFKGNLDEVAIWSRALSAGEATQLFRRGSNRVKYQIRSCSAADCSDQESLTANYRGWKGPDNTGATYFSELYNTTNNIQFGVPSANAPLMTFSNFAGSGLAVTTNRYFQYRLYLESNDPGNLCNYGSGAVPCSPEVKSITIGPNHFDTTIQSIISNAGLGVAYQTFTASGVTEILGSNSCSSGIRYALSSDGTNFYYWNNTSWVASSSYSTANDIATLNANIVTFSSSPAGLGTLQVKAYLKSSGTSPCELDSIQFTGTSY